MNAPSNKRTSSSPVGSSVAELPLPSIASLVETTGIAFVIAIVLLVFVVLPAEYNIDVTGFGNAIGLTRLSAPDPGGEEASGSIESEAFGRDGREDSVVIEIPAGSGLEYKFSLLTGEKMKYNWKIEVDENALEPGPESLIYDFHGEPDGAEYGFFESYSASNANGAKGTFTAPFDGVHGWYWNNNIGTSPVRITLTTSGSYEVLGLR